MEPVVEILWRGPDEKYALGLEVALIYLWKRKCDGGTLTNMTLGGEGSSGNQVSEETHRRISVAVTGRKHSEEALLNMSKAQKGRVVSEEHRLNMSKTRKGYITSEDTKRTISMAQKGRVMSEEARLKMKGHTVSKETGHKLSLAKKGHTVSEETRRKISLANTGRVLSLRRSSPEDEQCSEETLSLGRVRTNKGPRHHTSGDEGSGRTRRYGMAYCFQILSISAA